MSNKASFRKAIATLTIGDFYQKMAAITHPIMIDYANRCGADFVVIDKNLVNTEFNLPDHYEKFQLFHLLDNYDQIVFIDTDILITPDAPSLFENVPINSFAATSKPHYADVQHHKNVTQTVLGEINWVSPYFNSGVMVLDKTHKELFDPQDPLLKLWSSGDFRKIEKTMLKDQPYLNHKLNKLGISLLDLGEQYNHTRIPGKTHHRFSNYFIHYAGANGHRFGDRLSQLEKDAKILGSAAAYNLSKKFPAYRWLMDRLEIDFLKSRIMK